MIDIAGKWSYILIGSLLFIVGWYSGRVTSPYSASHQIVFQDRDAQACALSAGGSTQALVDLRDAGQATQPTPSATAGTAPSPTATVAGVTTSVQPSSQKLWVASTNSTLFHFKDCPTVARIKEANRVWFATAQAAENAGYKPSACATTHLGEGSTVTK